MATIEKKATSGRCEVELEEDEGRPGLPLAGFESHGPGAQREPQCCWPAQWPLFVQSGQRQEQLNSSSNTTTTCSPGQLNKHPWHGPFNPERGSHLCGRSSSASSPSCCALDGQQDASVFNIINDDDQHKDKLLNICALSPTAVHCHCHCHCHCHWSSASSLLMTPVCSVRLFASRLPV